MKKFFRKKTWWQKKTKNWTGKDMLAATGAISAITTLICGLPFVGVIVKEKLD